MFDSIYNNNHYPFDDNNNNNNSHFLSSFPSHLLGDDELFMDTVLPYHHQPPPPPPPPQPPLLPPQPLSLSATNPGLNMEEIRKPSTLNPKKKQDGGGGSSRRKAGKKDRHSKIYTAHGPRDRRMRLSLQIARKFFDLQDMLGFDKASKTIEWLFNKSRAAIKDVADKSCITITPPLGEVNCEGGSRNKEKLLSERKNMNEKRKEARARARERTKEKLMKNKEVLKMEEQNPNNIGLENNNFVRVDKVHQQLEHQMASVGIIEKFLASSSSMADFGHDFQESAFSMEFSRNRATGSSRINDGLLQELVVNSDYSNQVQGPNCAFMDRTYNNSRYFNY